MKRILFLMMVALIMIACGSDNEKTPDEYFSYMPMQKLETSYDGKYILTQYYDQKGNMFGLYKTTENLIKREEDKIWENAIEIIKETIDIGYGQTIEVEYTPSAIRFFPGETYNTYAVYIDGHRHAYCYFHNENGKIMRKSKITLSTAHSSLMSCPWDISKAIAVVSVISTPTENNRTIIEYNKNGEEKQFTIQLTPENNYLSYRKWTKINNNQYFVPSEKYIFIFSLNNDTFTEIHKINLEKYIDSLYPNEKNAPKIEIKDIEVFSDYSIANVKVTLYSGITDIIEVKIDNKTGEIRQ